MKLEEGKRKTLLSVTHPESLWSVTISESVSDSVVSDSAIPWTVIALQAPPSMGFSRQEYGSGLPFPLPGDLPEPGIKPRSPALQADSLPSGPPPSLGHQKRDNSRKHCC